MGDWFKKVLQLLVGLAVTAQGIMALQAESEIFCWGGWFALLIGILVAATAAEALMEMAARVRWWR